MYIKKMLESCKFIHKNIVGSKILEIRLVENNQETDKYIIAIDSVGAGIGEYVLITTGSGARLALPNRETPVDATMARVVGIMRTLLHEADGA